MPAHESKTWMASTPASSWTRRNAMVRSVSFSINACQLSGSASIIALVRAWVRLGPPSTR
ncbi:hypothetical protein C1Y40_02558 [Mycobacterium talmoniae]|uniref:Uncharacterized protein n=1 Tax=Mycobacterium talmoniae TaxID=1858794 RepID=A0A2S8BKV6_9MYCO|nr:hypothetical protein C1Y40_02558 [Mycobacterium talmoniae]